MFNKNAKFKLWFWSISLIITLGLGTTGAVKNYLDTKDERERARLSSKETSRIIIEGNIPSMADEGKVTNFITSILNDAKDNLVVNDDIVTLNDKGKLIATVKYMYLNSELTLTNGLNEDQKNEIIIKSRDLFGNYVKYDSYKVNYSNSFCGSNGYDSDLNVNYGDSNSGANEQCEAPYILFAIDKIRYDKDTYAAQVYVSYVNEEDATEGEAITELTCNENETKYFRNITLYKDNKRNEKFYEVPSHGCCTSGSCPSGGIMQNRNSLLTLTRNYGDIYYFRFDKTSDGDEYKFNKIEIVHQNK